MRPIRLTMTAFGPYRDVEVIDFKELNDRNLFLITGPTGAGKTTIFDAISFAMYGEASGNTRSAESLRSQFADDKVMTEVELDFELRGTSYNIHRIPKQQKPKSRGEGFTEQKSDATLTIFKDGENKVITGVKSVNDKIEELVGINAEQFRQIMMIPQGEFRKLLMADSTEREKVLRQLFDTSVYNAMQAKLESRAKALNSDIKGQRQLRDHEISKIAFHQDEKLKDLVEAEDKNVDEIVERTRSVISSDEKDASAISSSMKQVGDRIKSEISSREKALQTNKSIRDKEEVQKRIGQEEERSSEIEDKKKSVDLAKKAAKIVPIEENLKSRQVEMVSKSQEMEGLKNKIMISKAEFEKAEASLRDQESQEKQDMRKTAGEESLRLRSFEEKVSKIEDLKTSVSQREKSFSQLDASKFENETKIKLFKDRTLMLRRRYEKTKDADARLLEMRAIYKEEEGKKKAVDSLTRLNSEISGLFKDEKVQSVKMGDLKKSLEEFEKAYRKKKIDFLMNQAAVLAKGLEEGDPCPVCGSTHHESLAKFTGSEISQDQLDADEKKLQKMTDEYNKETIKLEKISNGMDSLEKQFKAGLSELESMQDVKTDISLASCGIEERNAMLGDMLLKIGENLESIKEEGKKLGEQSKEHKKIEAEISDVEKLIAQLESDREKIEKEHSSSKESLVKSKSELESIYKDVPEEIRTKESLKAAIEKSENLLFKLEADLNLARKTFDSVKLELATLQTKEEEVKKAKEKLSKEVENLKSEFDAKIEEYGFESKEAYESSKLTEEESAAMEAQIKSYSENLHSLKQKLSDLAEATEGASLTDTSRMDQLIELLEGETKKLIDEKSKIENRIENNRKIIGQIESINESISDKDAKNRVIGHLARIAKGDNKARMTFERYVLAAFLEDIIKAANIRLSKMTGGRYHMARTEELQRKNAQSGLELEVYDNYTGKSRHVKTLSGGESFKASLSMALGLSDFVQSYSGGVQLDTMFIDEGFGTLDQESLDSAISCLIELQKSGRLVGIISHVQELKERIDARLEVESTNTGSETRFVIN